MEKPLEIRKKFRNRLLGYLVLSTVFPAAVYLIIIYIVSLKSLHLQSHNESMSSAKLMADKIEKWQIKNLTLLQVMTKEFTDLDLTHIEKKKIFKNIQKLSPSAYAVLSVNPEGKALVRGDNEVLLDYSDRDYFKKVMTGSINSEAVFSRLYNKPAICTAAPVNKNATINEVLIICSFLEDLIKDLGSFKMGESGYLFLTDEQGRAVAHPNTPFLQPLKLEIERRPFLAFQNETKYELDFQENGLEYFSYAVPVLGNWLVVALQPKSEALATVNKTLLLPICLGIFFILIGIILTFIAVDRSTKPLNDLANAVNEFGQQNFQVRVHLKTKDELKLLAESFNQMADKIERHTNNLNQTVSQQSQQLVYSTKMSSLGEMASGIAHEINNPLAIISLQVDSLKQIINKENPKKEILLAGLKKIEDTCLRITQIIKGLRIFSRDGSNDPIQLENLLTIFSNTENLVGELLRKRGIQLIIDCSPDLEIECQPVPLSQVFVNLVMNSKDAIEKNKDKWIKIEANEANDKIFIRISDSGKGIPVEIQTKMMNPFFTTKGIGEGTGLGLAISKGIIEQHHGKIWYNPHGENTEFCILLPKKQNLT